jgi:serine/threonine-protein kinase
MERLVGQDLAHHLRQRHRLEPLEVVQLAEQVATVIDEAAKKGLVHRDLKPQNLFFDEREPERPCWKVLDFGVSKLLGSGTVAQNRLLGTPTYMAPEQARGNEVDSRADLYALGVVVYRALTGRPAFRGDDISALLLQVVHQMPTVPSDLGDLPEAVDDVLLLAMAKRPEDRYASASEFAGALREALLEGTVSDRALALRAADVRQRQPWRRDVQRLEPEDETTLVAGRKRLS